MAVTPASFLAGVAPFGARNDHLLRDLTTASLALTCRRPTNPPPRQANPTRQRANKP